jgi:hypothetical protein
MSRGVSTMLTQLPARVARFPWDDVDRRSKPAREIADNYWRLATDLGGIDSLSTQRGHRTIEQTNDKGSAQYDNINVSKGTARIISNGGASDIAVWRDAQNDLWMLERTPSGNEVVTTVFPLYAEGTDRFVVLESRHSLAISGQIAIGETAFGSCRVWE